MTMTIQEKVEQVLSQISCVNCRYGKDWKGNMDCLNQGSPAFQIEEIEMPFFCNFWEEKK